MKHLVMMHNNNYTAIGFITFSKKTIGAMTINRITLNPTAVRIIQLIVIASIVISEDNYANGCSIIVLHHCQMFYYKHINDF
jgi:hypothetical protein